MEEIYKKIAKANFVPRVLGGGGLSLLGLVFLVMQVRSILRGGHIYAGDIIFSLGGLCMAAGGLWYMITYFTGAYKKHFIKSLEIGNIWQQELVDDMNEAVELAKGKIAIGKKYVIMYSTNPDVGVLEDIIWAYNRVETTNYKWGGIIPMGTTKQYKVVMLDKNKMKGELAVDKPEMAEEILAVLSSRAPHVIMGYDERLLAMYKTDFDAMVQMVEDRKRGAKC